MTRELWRDLQVSGYGHSSDGGGGGWPGLRQVVLVRTTRELAYEVAPAPIVEDHYYLSSLCPVSHTASEMLDLVRSHWGIENKLHHVKDRTLGEDAQRFRPGATTASYLRSIVVGLYERVRGACVPEKRSRLQARPRLAVRLLHQKQKPKTLL